MPAPKRRRGQVATSSIPSKRSRRHLARSAVSRPRAQSRDIETRRSPSLDIAQRSPKVTRNGLRSLLLRFPVGLVAAIDREVVRRHATKRKTWPYARPPKRVDVIRDLVAGALKVNVYDGSPRPGSPRR